MEIYNKKRWWKFMLFVGAAAISLFSLLYTNRLTSELKQEEQIKIELWAEANRLLAIDASPGETMSLIVEILRHNTTVPVIVTTDEDEIIFHRNVSLPRNNQEQHLRQVLEKMKRYRDPFPVKLAEDEFQYIYFHDSILLRKLQWFPIVQLIIVFVFMLVAYVAFSVARKLEQDQVWVGMARETAHQLGTPTTSLLGWMDVLTMKNTDPELIKEMHFDIQRLQTITSRFSKIGSKPDLKQENIIEVIESMVSYLRKRSSSLVSFTVVHSVKNPLIPLSKPLFEWVVENLCKNAIDAMEGEGQISILIRSHKDSIFIDISDTGRGMSRQTQKTAFKPGYSTKSRGWGLGLTLSHRIIEHYHKGKISILSSVPNKGTTFRVVLPSEV
ncbi:ATP-binding protein [Alkalitalea saponilacus]|uniref:histidine kinase n=1 Tax=Alkalitalea saponilacus TaxID=889453 RepID=A0A1T5HMI5_9BACT|nr:HAMP domain-containing sensor histidine kinase [Alkalitalea saponilacus]ASB49394.1 ATP-binding protein [Alkalitalea saponilacus]SKC21883.1 Signal transduction histidine kinase [Alkalitalea saponilacus]